MQKEDQDILQKDISEIVHRMFIATADRNYILARQAFFMMSMTDFYWLSLHALEKYMKGILLLNGKTSTGFKHNLSQLQLTIEKMDKRFQLGKYKHPDKRIPQKYKGILEGYLVFFLNEAGDPDSRYAVRGQSMGPEDLFIVDQLVWAARRYCRPFQTDKDAVALLQADPEKWRLSLSLPIESLLSMPEEDPFRKGFLYKNMPFNKTADFSSGAWMGKSQSSVVSDWINRVEFGTRPEAIKRGRRVLQWVLERITLPKQETDRITAALNTPRS